MLYQLLLIQIIIVFIIDLSGIIDTLKSVISRLLTGYSNFNQFSIKPFDCSLCMMFWSGLIYIIASAHFCLLNLLWVCLLSYLTPITNTILINIKDILLYLLNKIYDKIYVERK